jgi:FkbM family methyltransferase
VSPFTARRTFAVADYQVTVPARSLFARTLAKYQAYEALNSNWIVSRFRGTTGGLFVDVGANFGWYSMLTARLAPAATVIAVEPSRENYALLTHNISSNRFTNIVALNKGAGAVSTEVSLYAHEHDNPGAHSIRKAAEDVTGEKISIEPLDSLLAPYDGPINLMKIDVEGYEIDALLGAAKTLQRTNCILLEYSPGFLLECGHEPTQLLEILQAQGFHPHLVRETSLEPIEFQRLEQRDPHLARQSRWQVDLVFTRA